MLQVNDYPSILPYFAFFVLSFRRSFTQSIKLISSKCFSYINSKCAFSAYKIFNISTFKLYTQMHTMRERRKKCTALRAHRSLSMLFIRIFLSNFNLLLVLDSYHPWEAHKYSFTAECIDVIIVFVVAKYVLVDSVAIAIVVVSIILT